MTDPGLISLFLFLHVGAAIIAFGPTFVFPIVGRFAAREPMHGNFAIRINEAIENKLVIPFALTMPVSGALLIWLAHFNLLDRTAWWLDLAIVAYVIAISMAILLQRPAIEKLIHMTSRPPAGAPAMAGDPAMAGAPAMGGAAAMAPGASAMGGAPGMARAGGAPMGPPPEIAAITAMIRRNGSITGILLIVIVVLMVVKPQF